MPANDGTLSPITSSSGQHVEEPDNSVEYYVKASQQEAEYVDSANNSRTEKCSTCKFFLPEQEGCTVVTGRIEAGAYCKLYVEGGEKMTEKGLDVEESVTTDESYVADHGTTEPDPESELAMQKGISEPTYTKEAELEGVDKYSTTANTTTDAPSPGETTEPSSIHKASCCDDCGPECSGDCCQKCAKMAKAACCDDCGPECNGKCCEKCAKMAKAAGCSCTCDQCQKCMGMKKAADPEDKEAKEEEKEEDEMKKSVWGGAFAPGIPTAAVRMVFRQE